MEEKNTVQEKEKIFKPRRRRLIDLLLFLNMMVFIAAAFKPIVPWTLGVFYFFMNSTVILFWFFFLTPLMTIRIANNMVTGRDDKFMKQSIPFRKIHFTHTIVSPKGMKRRFFKDIHSIDGKIIRIHRPFLGEGKVNAIIVTIERYPFREGTT